MRRRLTRREKRKRSKQLVMIISICLLLVIGVGYAAFSTTLTLKAKGNIKCGGTLAKDLLLKEVVTNGDGLYKDEYEQGKYFYRGINPNNYITFNNELWRIISIELNGTIKIIKNMTLGTYSWDSNRNTWDADWSNSSLKKYLNETYYNSLNNIAKKQIISHYWLPSGMTGKSVKDNIALITVPEYFQANSNVNQCGTGFLNSENASICKDTNWIYNMILNDTKRGNGNWIWTMTSTLDIDTELYNLVYRLDFSSGNFTIDLPVNGHSHVYPTVYLSSEIKITGGNGSSSSPYTLG